MKNPYQFNPFREPATIQFLNLATQTNFHPNNQQDYQKWITANRICPNSLISNALKLSVHCLTNETHMHLPRVRVLSVLYYINHQLNVAYSETVFEGSKPTGELPGWVYAKEHIQARMKFEEEMISIEHTTSEMRHEQFYEMHKHLKCYREFEELKKTSDHLHLKF